MTEIEQINGRKTFWKRSTMEIITYTDGSLADIIQLARKDILSLITTLESQKECWDDAEMRAADAIAERNDLQKLVESQKEEIEISYSNFMNLRKESQKKSASIELLKRERDHNHQKFLMKSEECQNNTATIDMWRDRFKSSTDTIESLKAITELAAKALEWYADKENYTHNSDDFIPVEKDDGNRAQSTLEEIKRRNHANKPNG